MNTVTTVNSAAFSAFSMAAQKRVSTLVVFDARLADLDVLYGALLPGAVGRTIESTADGLVEITRLLAESGAKSLAIVAHGEPGVIHLGREPIDLEVLSVRSGLLQEWCVDEISLYSCEVGADVGFVGELERVTGARVAASAQKVGADALGGTWNLINSHSSSVFHSQSISSYSGIFATTTVAITTANNATINRTTTLGFTVDVSNTTGQDLLIAAYSGTTLIGWQIVNRSTNFTVSTTAVEYTGTFDFASAGLSAVDVTGITLRAWQGTAGSGYSAGVTYGNGNITNGAANGFRANNNTAPAAGTGAINFTTPTTGSITATNNTILIDNIAPTVIDNNISISGATGAGGAYKVGDTVTAVWDSTGNTDMLSSVAVDFSQFGGGNAIAAALQSSGVNTGKYVATYTIVGGSINSVGNKNVSVSVTDNAANVTTALDTTNATVDNAVPSAPIITEIGGTDGTVSTAANDNKVVGTAEAGSTVSVLTSTNTLLGTTTANVSGDWSYTFTLANIIALGQGLKNVIATATDTVGNVSAASSTFNFFLDTIAPNAPSITNITDNVGSIQTPITNGTATDDTTPTFTISLAGTGAGVGDIVKLFNNGTTQVIAYTLNNADITAGTVSLTPAALAQGNYSITSTIIDAAGNQSSASAVRTFTVDATAPSVTITDNGGTTATGDITYTFTFDEAVTGFADTDVVVANGTKGTFTAVSSTQYTLVVTPTDGFEGNVTVDVAANVANDVAGNGNVVATQNVQAVDTKEPSVTITDNGGTTATGDITYTFTFDEAVTGFADTDVVVANGTKGLFTAVSNTVYTLVVTPTDGFEGNVTIDVAANVANDVAGNGNVIATQNVQAVDTKEPSVTITDNGGTTATGDITYTFTFDEAVTGFADTDVVVANGTKGLFTAVSSTVYTLVVTPTDGFEGNVTVDVAANVANDVAGNGNAIATQNVQAVDTLEPTAPVISAMIANDTGVSNTDRITQDKTPTITGTAEANSIIQLFNGIATFGTTTADNTGAWSFTPAADLTDAVYNITAKATDAAGNTSIASAPLSIEIDTTADAGTALAFANVNTLVNNTTANNFTFNLNGVDAGNTTPVVTISDGSNSITATQGAGTSWSADISGLNDGTLSITATTSDVAGNAATITQTSILLDTVAPATPTIVSISDDTGITTDTGSTSDKRTSDTSLTLNGTAEIGSNVRVFNGNTLLGTATVSSGGTWSYVVPGTLTDGTTYNFRARAVDAVGNLSFSTANNGFLVTIDTTAPGAPTIINFSNDTGTSPTDGITNDNTLTITGTAASDAAEVEIFNGTTSLGKATVASGNWTLTTAALPDATYTLTAKVLDIAGNTSIVSTNSLNISIDTTAPTAITPTTIPNLNENNAANAVVTTLSATDSGAGNSGIVFSLVSGQVDNAAFTINGTQLQINAAANAEVKSIYNLLIRATDAAGNFTDFTRTLNINDVDEFDVTAPTDSNSLVNEVLENAANGTAVGLTAAASDGDATNNVVTYSLVGAANGTGAYNTGEFTIDVNTGVVTVAGGIDREAGVTRTLFVKAASTDGSTATSTFTIAINDFDEFDVTAPTDSNNLTVNEVLENAANGTVVGLTAYASDGDATNSGVTYSLVGAANGTGAYNTGEFAIDANTGVVTVAGGIDREAGATRTLFVKATSTDGSTATSTFTIAINDFDEFDVTAPTDSNGLVNEVLENAANGTLVGLTAAALDGDATNNGVTYSLTNDAGGLFAIDFNTGVVTVNGSISYETATTQNITVQALSIDGSTSTANFTININDVNEAPTAINLSASSIAENNALNAVVATLSAIDPDGAATTFVAPFTYALVTGAGDTDNIAFTINGSNLQINASADFETKPNYQIRLQVTDNAGLTFVTNKTITITDINDAPALTLTPAPLPNATEDNSYIINQAALLSGFTDQDLPAQTLTVQNLVLASSSTGAGNLAILGAGQWLFAPNANYNGTVNLTYSISDGITTTAATKSFVVNPVNDAPTGSPTGTLNGTEDTILTINEAILLAGFSDPDANTTLRAINLTVTTNGTGILSSPTGVLGSRQWTFTPVANYNGSVNLSYDVSDGIASVINQALTINLAAVNDAPTLTGTPVILNPLGTTSFTINASDLLAGFTDIEGDTLSVSGLIATNGNLINNNNGTYSFTPTPSYNGSVDLTYNVIDGNGGITPATQSFKLSFTRNDFDGDGKADILFRDNSNNNALFWKADGINFINPATQQFTIGNVGSSTWSIVGSGDFNGDKKSDVLWKNTDGSIAVWIGNGTGTFSQGAVIGNLSGTTFQVAGTGDFNGDLRDDILFKDASGAAAVWLTGSTGLSLDGTGIIGSVGAGGWQVAGTGDFTGDNKADVLWRDTASGQIAVWQGNGKDAFSASNVVGTLLDPTWQIEGVDNFSGDSRSDILWRNTTDGTIAIWQGNGLTPITQTGIIGTVGGGAAGAAWNIAGTGNYNGDATSDILFRNGNSVAVWLTNGSLNSFAQGELIGTANSAWTISAPTI